MVQICFEVPLIIKEALLPRFDGSTQLSHMEIGWRTALSLPTCDPTNFASAAGQLFIRLRFVHL